MLYANTECLSGVLFSFEIHFQLKYFWIFVGKSFVEDNFADLIQNVTNVDAILDKLVGLIHSETISTIRSERTNQKKMRELILLVGKTLSPVAFYKSLQDVHPELVKKTKGHHGANYWTKWCFLISWWTVLSVVNEIYPLRDTPKWPISDITDVISQTVLTFIWYGRNKTKNLISLNFCF